MQNLIKTLTFLCLLVTLWSCEKTDLLEQGTNNQPIPLGNVSKPLTPLPSDKKKLFIVDRKLNDNKQYYFLKMLSPIKNNTPVTIFTAQENFRISSPAQMDTNKICFIYDAIYSASDKAGIWSVDTKGEKKQIVKIPIIYSNGSGNNKQLVTDRFHQKIYWGILKQPQSSDLRIFRSDFNGKNIEEVNMQGFTSIQGFNVDGKNERIYFHHYSNNTPITGCSDLNGNIITPLVASLNNLMGIPSVTRNLDLDIKNGIMYTNAGGNLYAAKMNGVNSIWEKINLNFTGFHNAFDFAASRMYFYKTGNNLKLVSSSDMEGNNLVNLVPQFNEVMDVKGIFTL